MLIVSVAQKRCFRLVLLLSSGDNDPPARGQKGRIRPSVRRREREKMAETRGGITGAGNNGPVNASLCVSVSKEAFMGGGGGGGGVAG